jgi:hypothetical protein
LGHDQDRQHVSLDPFQKEVLDDAGLVAIEQAELNDFLDFRTEYSA